MNSIKDSIEAVFSVYESIISFFQQIISYISNGEVGELFEYIITTIGIICFPLGLLVCFIFVLPLEIFPLLALWPLPILIYVSFKYPRFIVFFNNFIITICLICIYFVHSNPIQFVGGDEGIPDIIRHLSFYGFFGFIMAICIFITVLNINKKNNEKKIFEIE